MNKTSQLTIALLLSAGAAFSQQMSTDMPRGTLLKRPVQTDVPADVQQRLRDRQAAADKKAFYERGRAIAEQRYRDCIVRPSQFPNQNNCQSDKNAADYYAGMSAAVPNPDLTGSVTGQPLPAPGATGGIGGVAVGSGYGVVTGQVGPSFNGNSQTISTKPVIDARSKINNSRGSGSWGGWKQGR